MRNRRLNLRIVSALLVLAIAALACGTDAGAPAAGGTALTEQQALKKAYDRSHNKPYANLQGTPISAWGDTMTYAEAADLMGNTISPDTSEYERRNDRVWYIVLEG